MKKLIGTAATILACALGAALPASSANAAIVTQTFSVSATGYGASAPYQDVSGTFSITFDNAASVAGATDGLSIGDFTLSQFASAYSYNKATDLLVIATSPLQAGCANKPNGYCLFVRNISTAPVGFGNVTYNLSGATFRAPNVVSSAASAVPEPASWAMMLAGFGMVGFGLRRRAVRTAVAYA